MKTSIRIIAVLVLIASMAVSTLAIADDNVGMVVASRGEVLAMAKGGSRELKQGDLVYVDDEIMTANRSFAVLQFVDGAKVSLRPDSYLIIEQYLYASSGQDAATLKLVSGGLRVVSGAIANAQPENYKIRTPLALMSVQGAEGSLTLCGEDICEQEGLAEIPE